jgi:hypothetical protein
MDVQPLTTVSECTADEGKVIRVVNGKSTTVNTTKPSGSQSPTPPREHGSLMASKRSQGSLGSTIVGGRTL